MARHLAVVDSFISLALFFLFLVFFNNENRGLSLILAGISSPAASDIKRFLSFERKENPGLRNLATIAPDGVNLQICGLAKN